MHIHGANSYQLEEEQHNFTVHQPTELFSEREGSLVGVGSLQVHWGAFGAHAWRTITEAQGFRLVHFVGLNAGVFSKL